MTNTANLQNCRTLYELKPEWWGAHDWWINVSGEGWQVLAAGQKGLPPDEPGHDYIPAYDVGFLLRKLPHEILEKPDPTTYEHYALKLGAETSGEWYANYWMFDYPRISLDDIEPSDTPENALCQLAISLCEQGILK